MASMVRVRAIEVRHDGFVWLGIGMRGAVRC
jgi:hypothetical protein